MTKVTLIMIINSENYHEKKIQNILKYSVYDFELIWIKNYSKQGENIAINDSRIKIKESEENNLMKTLNLSINEAQGKYIIFTNTLNILLDDTLKRGYNKLEENNADMIIFSGKTKESTLISRITQGKPFNIEKIREHIFSTNFQLQDCLYNKQFLLNKNIQFNTHNNNDSDVFVFKSLIKSDKILLYEKRLNNPNKEQITIQEYKQYLENLEYIQEMFYQKDNRIIEQAVNNYAINQAIKAYNKIGIKNKKAAYNLLRTNFIEKLNTKTIEQYIKTLTSRNKKQFEQVIITESVEEYELLKKVYEDKKHINYMKRYEQILQTEYKKIREFNHSLISSNSWKITKFLRIRNKL